MQISNKLEHINRKNLRTSDHGLGEVHCKRCSEINHDIKAERKTNYLDKEIKERRTPGESAVNTSRSSTFDRNLLGLQSRHPD